MRNGGKEGKMMVLHVDRKVQAGRKERETGGHLQKPIHLLSLSGMFREDADIRCLRIT